GDLECLLAGIRLRDEELVDVDPARPRVARVERVLDVDERGDAAPALGLGDDVLAERGLARRLRAEDLRDPAARDAAHAEREVERDGAGRDGIDLLPLGRAELHDRAAAELLLDGEDRGIDRPAALRIPALAAVAGVDVSSGDGHRFIAPLGPRRPDGAGPGPRPPKASTRLGLVLVPARLALLADELGLGRTLREGLQRGFRRLVLRLLLHFLVGAIP